MNAPNPLLPELAEALDQCRSRARFAVAMLGFVIVTELSRVVSASMQLVLLQGALTTPISEATANANDQRHMAVVGVSLLATVLSLIALSRWIGRAYQAIPLMDATPLPFTASQARWSFWIPFVNFVRPFQVVRDLFRATDPELAQPNPQAVTVPNAGYRDAAMQVSHTFVPKTDAPIAAWWGLWIGSKLIGRLANNAPSSNLEGEALIRNLMTATMVDVLYGAMMVASSVVGILVVLRVDERMRLHARRMGAELAA